MTAEYLLNFLAGGLISFLIAGEFVFNDKSEGFMLVWGIILLLLYFIVVIIKGWNKQ